jgi:hypothetical protein
MAGTYLSALLVLLAAAGVGHALFAACGRREWSWLAPAVGLALVCAGAWGLLNVTGEPVAAAAGIAITAAGGIAVLVVRRAELVEGVLPALFALALASLPFIVEGRFGILGTSLNPDMSQHLFAADRLISGGSERLIAEGYPLGPHAVAAGLESLRPSLVEAFGGLTVAVAVCATLAPLAILGRLAPARRVIAALLVGFAYMASSYLIQGAFKETMQALFVLAFAVGVHELAGGSLGGRAPAARWRSLRAVPLAALGAGCLYAYSFPGLAWLVGGLGLWALLELVARRSLAGVRGAVVPTAMGAGALVLAALPELGRIADFASFETFDPDGAGLGNLFNPVSPLEALGIWPSGDFRLDPGAGFAPAAAFWLGGLVGLAALGYGLIWSVRRRELAIPAFVGAGTLLYLYPLIAGTPYQEAKAIAVVAPVAMLCAIRPLLTAAAPLRGARTVEERAPRASALVGALAAAFVLAAAGSSVLALVNGPVGPADWGPDLIELRASGELGPGGEKGDDTLIVGAREFMVDERGADLALWELRGGRVCFAYPETPGASVAAPDGTDRFVFYEAPRVVSVVEAPAEAAQAPGSCPFIADGDRADPGS